MTVAQRDEIARKLQQKTTEELLAILVDNDQGQWQEPNRPWYKLEDAAITAIIYRLAV
jgi:hypothetical protein